MNANAPNPVVHGDVIPVDKRETDCPTQAAHLMSCEDVARYLQVPVSWIHDNHQRLDLPALKLGRHLRFRTSDVDAWLETRKRYGR